MRITANKADVFTPVNAFIANCVSAYYKFQPHSSYTAHDGIKLTKAGFV